MNLTPQIRCKFGFNLMMPTLDATMNIGEMAVPPPT